MVFDGLIFLNASSLMKTRELRLKKMNKRLSDQINTTNHNG